MLNAVALRYCGLALQFLSLVMLARALSPSDYGWYVFVLSIVMPTYFLVGAGSSEAFARSAASGKTVEPEELKRGVAACALTCAMTLACYLGLGWMLLRLGDPTGLPVAIVCLGAVLLVANGVSFNIAQVLLGIGVERLGGYYFYPAVNLCVVIAVTGYSLLAESVSLRGISVILAGLVAASLAIGMIVIYRNSGIALPRRHDFTGQLRSGLWLTTGRALYAVGLWITPFAAGLILGPVESGQLGTVGRVAAAVLAILAALRFAIRPRIALAGGLGDFSGIAALGSAAAGLSAVVAAVATLVAVAGGERLLVGLFGPTLIGAGPVLILALLAVLVESASGPVDEILKMTGHERVVVAVYGAGIIGSAGALTLIDEWTLLRLAVLQLVYVSITSVVLSSFVRQVTGFWVLPTVGKKSRRLIINRRGDV